MTTIRMGSLLLAISLLAATAPLAAADEAVAPAVAVVSAEFGVFDASDAREVAFSPTRVVPHRAGQRYGWVIDLQTSRRSLSVREEYLLPNPVKTPKSDDPIVADLDVPLYRHNQVSQRQLVPVDGKIYGEWEVGPAEPAGHRRLQVVVEDPGGGQFRV